MPRNETQKSEHSCEICRTLDDVVQALEPQKYVSGPALDVAQAIQTALTKHLDRVRKDA